MHRKLSGERTRERAAHSYEFRDDTSSVSCADTFPSRGRLEEEAERRVTMSREKPYFREVVADIIERTGKTILGVNDLRKFLGVGHNKAVGYLEKGEKTITAYQLAQKLI